MRIKKQGSSIDIDIGRFRFVFWFLREWDWTWKISFSKGMIDFPFLSIWWMKC